jgi:cytochrome c oxidase assembly factor CtaG
MIQHLLLMSVAAPLILLGQPLLVLTNGLPSGLVDAVGRLLCRRRIQQLGAALVTPTLCWIAATAALVVWHVPAALTLTMQSNAWHAVAQASFGVTGLLFWWPVVQPWPSLPAPQWSTVLYLFLAMLPCDVLSAFLVFSDRIAYSTYVSMPGHTSLSVLEDQEIAGALMWTVVTLVYLTAGTIVATRLLSPRAVEAV